MEIQFDEGILRITIPKLNIGPKENAKETILQEALIEPIPPNGHEDILPKTTSDTNNEQQKPEEKIEAVISQRSSEAENVMEDDKEDEIGERSKESKTSTVSVLENKEKEKNESDTNLETKRGGGDYEEKPGKVGVSNTGQNEEKQMLINVGAAPLVIFTVSAQLYNAIIGFSSPS
ncbi:uncharacterized protein LOC120005513 [Tripterygium wilfordii]|nr:uncharacterized protein LOC120005513 [Tripterygium wilfordii]